MTWTTSWASNRYDLLRLSQNLRLTVPRRRSKLLS